MKFKIGCDPELFVFNRASGNYKCAEVPGTKEDPFKLSGGAVQLDGVAAEFNIDPATCAEEFDHNVQTVLSGMQKFLAKDEVFFASPVVTFSYSEWKTIPKERKVLGCNPDFGLDGEPIFDKKTEVHLNKTQCRTGAGHIHIGWGENIIIDDNHLGECQLVAGLFESRWTSLTTVADGPESPRRKFYGLPYAHRPKPYGVELRIPSNNWLNIRDKKAGYQWVFNLAYEFIDQVANEKDLTKIAASFDPLSFSQKHNLQYPSKMAIGK